jgi:hypothetical protein
MVPVPRGYRFLADPFFHPAGGLLVEGFNAQTSRGEILHLDADGSRRISGVGGHYSYPAPCFDGAKWHIVPEISEWSSARAYELRDDMLYQPAELDIAGRPRLLDPTPFRNEDAIYLFANLADEGPSVLRLWAADTMENEFTEHPSSPIRLSPHGSRMAGGVIRTGGELFRVGQDHRRGYGDGLSFFRITKLDRHAYEEQHVRDFRFDHCHGPHTLNIDESRAAFDFYQDRFMPLAGFRRLKERRAARRPR